jgi:hypothetical protein
MARGKLNQGTQRQPGPGGNGHVVSLLVLVFGIYQVGRLFDVFASRYPLVTLVENSAGLMAGAPVTLAGQRVGRSTRSGSSRSRSEWARRTSGSGSR